MHWKKGKWGKLICLWHNQFENWWILPRTSQLIGMRFRCFVEKNIKLTFGYPGETNKLYWGARNYTEQKRLTLLI